MKISIITVVYNRESTILDSMRSVYAQTYSNVEHIIIDGGSSDRTLEVINANKQLNTVVVSERDAGIYDALNKGINKSTGDVIGILHSDDFFADEKVLNNVASAFSESLVDVVYGDLDYVSKFNSKKILRRWRSGEFNPNRLLHGWMPPHPTVFVKRSFLIGIGTYNTNFKISADYDWIVRIFKTSRLAFKYLPYVMVKMRMGGESNQSIKKIVIKLNEDYQIIKNHKLGGLKALACKNFSKIKQFNKSIILN